MKIILIFSIAFLAPMIYWRTLFFVATRYFDKPYLRTKTGLQIHHLHYGAIFVFIASLILLFSSNNIYGFILLGLGLGLIFDEFIPSLMLPGNRPLELEIYGKSFRKTLILFIVITLFILSLALFFV